MVFSRQDGGQRKPVAYAAFGRGMGPGDATDKWRLVRAFRAHRPVMVFLGTAC